jgi:hypothetical protein
VVGLLSEIRGIFHPLLLWKAAALGSRSPVLAAIPTVMGPGYTQCPAPDIKFKREPTGDTA